MASLVERLREEGDALRNDIEVRCLSYLTDRVRYLMTHVLASADALEKAEQIIADQSTAGSEGAAWLESIR